MKNTKYIIALVALLAFALTACQDFFDEKQLDNGNYRPSDVRTSMTYTMSEDEVVQIGKESVYEQKALSLCTEDDSTAYTEWKKIASLKAFTEDASPDIYVPIFMAQKFPYLDAGTICNVTYPLYEGKSARQEPFTRSNAYVLTENDYRTIWNGRGASYLTPAKEADIDIVLKQAFPLAAEGKIIVVTYNYKETEPDEIIPLLPYECGIAELIESTETTEHQITGTISTIKSAASARFYLKEGEDSIYVYGMRDEEGKLAFNSNGLKQGDVLTVKGKLSLDNEEPQFVDAIYVSHNSASAAKRQVAAKNEPVKNVIFQLNDGKWTEYENDQLQVAMALPQSVYTSLGSDVVSNPDAVIGKYLRSNYPYPNEKEIYLIAYMSSNGMTADEWIFDGNDFVMNTGFTYDVMSFILGTGSWLANISTYYTTPFVGSGQADFTIQHVQLDGLTYVWRYQAAYGMTASAYVSGTNHPVEDWLISPKIRLKKSEKPVLTFDHAVRYGNEAYNKDWLKVMVSTNFTGDVTTTEWEHLQFPDSIPDGSNWVFLNTGDFDLSAYNGETITIAFQYNTTTGELTSAPTWEIQNLLVHELEDETKE